MNTHRLPGQSNRVAVLEQENDHLREQIRQLMEVMGATLPMPSIFGFSKYESRVFGVLMQRDAASKEQIFAAIYVDRFDDLPGIEIVDVFICKLRKKIRPYGIEITTIWGVGYALTSKAKALAQSIMASSDTGEAK